MGQFMHKLAEALRTREKYMEDHSDHPVFETDEGNDFKAEYDDLVSELKDLNGRIDKLIAEGKDYDEHFEREIKDEHQKLTVKIDSWAKNIPKK